MGPGVSRGPDLLKRRAVGIGEVVAIADGDWPMVSSRWLRRFELAGLVVQLGAIAFGRVTPSTLFGRHEADAVGSLAVVEAVRIDRFFALFECSGERCIDKRIAVTRPG